MFVPDTKCIPQQCQLFERSRPILYNVIPRGIIRNFRFIKNMFEYVVVFRPCRSYLAESALLDWSDANSTAVGVAKTCRAGQRDGINIAMNNKFASLGTDSFKNCNRDLDDLLKGVGAYDHVVETNGSCFTHCIPPTEIVKLLGKRPEKFKMHLAPSKDACREFWRGLFSSEQGMQYARSHPHLQGKTVKDLETTIATRLHEDSGPFTKVKGVDVLSWSSLLGKGTEKECKYQTLL